MPNDERPVTTCDYAYLSIPKHRNHTKPELNTHPQKKYHNHNHNQKLICIHPLNPTSTSYFAPQPPKSKSKHRQTGHQRQAVLERTSAVVRVFGTVRWDWMV